MSDSPSLTHPGAPSPAASPTVSLPDAPPAPPARLLLVDDDEDACRLLTEVLEREGYAITRALSAGEALGTVERAGPFDAVLTDLRMPGASGLDLLRALRERDPSALVLVLTAFGDAITAGE